ncbi:MAG: PIN domain-containing protein [Thaumarchaeota archaeon]|nr:PIN domain-containing protein [Nitrososphaerota archaeon]
MIVADSSYLVERIVERRAEFAEEEFLAPDFAIPEVINAILVQHRILHMLKDGRPYVSALFEAVDADSLRLVKVTESLAREAYEIALRNDEVIYDCIFVALALRYGGDLKTVDRRQAQVYAKESARKNAGDPSR